MKKLAFIFDLDGTLIDSSHDLTLAVNGMLHEIGYPKVTHEQVQGFIGDGTPKLAERALRHVGALENKNAPKFDKYFSILLKHYEANLANQTTVYPGVREFLEKFKVHPMAVVTNKPKQFTGPVLEAFKLLHYFQFWAGGDTFEKRKPDPFPVVKAMKELNSEPDRTFMIGDGDTDIKAGQAAGAITVAAIYGNRSPGELRDLDPDYEITEFSALHSIVEKYL
jgi:phosphoglycolate phosphatase